MFFSHPQNLVERSKINYIIGADIMNVRMMKRVGIFGVIVIGKI